LDLPLEKYSNTHYKNKQNINPACACHIYLKNSIILFYLLILNCVFKGAKQLIEFTNALKLGKRPGNTLDLNPKWQ
jgi:hypothetical protein